jgi:DNA-binding SARP family transcriptional activator/TolB-like protein
MLRLTTLGALDLRDGRGRPLREVLAQPKRVALLVYLAVEGSRAPIPRDRLLADFWPESDETRARNALSQSLHHLRQALGADTIVSSGATVSVDPALLWCDATAFADALTQGENELALDLYRGEFCPALFADGAPEVEQWLDRQRHRLRDQAFGAARTTAEALVAGGDRAGAIRMAKRALALHPDDEAEVRALLALLERAGDSAGALIAYQDYASRLAAHLDTEPEPRTRSLVEAIRARREQGSAPAAPEPAVAGEPRAGAAPLPAATLRPAPAARSRIRPVHVAAAAGLLVLIALGGTLAWPRRQREAEPQARTLAVFPFGVRGGPGMAYLREGMVDLLSAKLDGVTGLHAIDPRSVIPAVPPGDSSPRFAYPAVARELGAGRYITGEVVVVSGRVQVSGTLYDAVQRRALSTATVLGDSSAIFELVDALAGRLLADMVDGPDTTLTRLAAISTHSLPALKAFLEGEHAARAGQDARAAEAFREAATLDTGFALAQYRLAVAATWTPTPDAFDPTIWAARAARHAERLTPLARDLLTAYQAYRELRPDDAERAYRAITSSRPDNLEAWMMLGETLFHNNAGRGRSMQDAWLPFNHALALDPSNAHAMLHLARLAVAAGRKPAVDSLATAYFARYGDAGRAFEMRALVAYVSDDSAERRTIAHDAVATDDYMLGSLLAAAAAYAEDIDAARDLTAAYAVPGRLQRMRVVGRRILTDLDAAAGTPGRNDTHLPPELRDESWRLETAAMVAAEPFIPVPPERIVAIRGRLLAEPRWQALGTTTDGQDSPLGDNMRASLIARLSVRLGDSATADRYLARLSGAADAAGGRQMAAAVRAAMARARGDLPGALEALRAFRYDAPPGGLTALGHWGVGERFALAEVLLALGRDAEALPLYESFNGAYDLPFGAAAHLRRGEIYERRGDAARARFHYGRMVSMWRSSSPEYRELLARGQQALVRLAGRERT